MGARLHGTTRRQNRRIIGVTLWWYGGSTGGTSVAPRPIDLMVHVQPQGKAWTITRIAGPGLAGLGHRDLIKIRRLIPGELQPYLELAGAYLRPIGLDVFYLDADPGAFVVSESRRNGAKEKTQ